MVETVLNTIRRFQMLKPGDRILVACSGGPDSVALLHVLHRLAPELKLRLHVAHVNHGLRGRAADADARFVRQLATRLGLPCTVRTIRIRRRRGERPPGLEQAARNERYRALTQIAQRYRCTKIAVGHTQDDQAETVLMWLLRGAGTHGLAGMPSQREVASRVQLIRPLINATRREVMSYLRQHQLPYRRDRTNVNARHLRNKIRMRLLPLLEKEYNPSIRASLAHTAAIVADDADLLHELAAKAFPSVARVHNHRVRLHLTWLRRLAPSLQKAIVRLAIERLKGNLRRIEYRHWELISELMVGRDGLRAVALPGGLDANRLHDILLLELRN